MNKLTVKITMLALSLTLILTPTAPVYAEGNSLTDTINNIVETVDKTATTINKAVTNINNMFTDLKSHWAIQYIQSLIDTNIIKGYPDGTFRPDGNITVAEFTKILMLNSNVALGESGSNWYDQYINGAIASGIITKGEYTNYDRPLKRKEAARMIDRLLNKDLSNKLKFQDDKSFGTDLKSIYDVANQGIVKGYPDGTFRPDGSITRAEACTMISNFNNPQEVVVSTPVTDSKWTQEAYEKFWTETVPYGDWGDVIHTSSDHVMGFGVDENFNIVFTREKNQHEFEKYPESQWIKPLAGDLIKELLYYAEKNNHYVGLRKNLHGEEEYFDVGYYINEHEATIGRPVFRIFFNKTPIQMDDNGFDYNMTIGIHDFFTSDDYSGGYLSAEEYYEKVDKYDYVYPELSEPLKATMYMLFGKTDGQKMYDHIITTYRPKGRDRTNSVYTKGNIYFNLGSYKIQQRDAVDDAAKSWYRYTSYDLIYNKN